MEFLFVIYKIIEYKSFKDNKWDERANNAFLIDCME